MVFKIHLRNGIECADYAREHAITLSKFSSVALPKKKVVNLVRGYQCLALLILSIDFISRLFVVVKTFKRTLIKKMSILNS